MMTMTETKEKPILFSTEMIQAILAGRKTQTRRIIKANEKGHVCKGGYCIDLHPEHGLVWRPYGGSPLREYPDPEEYCPYGYPGNELWVRETWKPVSYSEHGWIIKYKDGATQEIDRLFPLEQNDKEIHWAEKTREEFENCDKIPWKPSIFMSRGASRIQLTVEDIRVERVQGINQPDARAEGIYREWDGTKHWYELYDEPGKMTQNPLISFKTLWDSINADRDEGQYSWESNPWVWVVEFKVKKVKG